MQNTWIHMHTRKDIQTHIHTHAHSRRHTHIGIPCRRVWWCRLCACCRASCGVSGGVVFWGMLACLAASCCIVFIGDWLVCNMLNETVGCLYLDRENFLMQTDTCNSTVIGCSAHTLGAFLDFITCFILGGLLVPEQLPLSPSWMRRGVSGRAVRTMPNHHPYAHYHRHPCHHS